MLRSCHRGAFERRGSSKCERADASRSREAVARRGGITVLLGRVVPGVRSLISVPPGVSDMPLAPFLA